MRYQILGKTDIEVSDIALGTWAIGGQMWGGTDRKASIEAIQQSIDSGINLIDTAPGYGKGLSEEIVGQAIKGKRDKVIIATKCGLFWDLKKGQFFMEYEGSSLYRYLGAESVKEELEVSLKKLDSDYVDLYITHWQDPTTPIEETMGALMDLKAAGKIRAIGVSNATIEDMEEYLRLGFVDADQEKYNLLEDKMENTNIAWCREKGSTFLAYSPLAQGLLTGKLDPQRKFPIGDLRRDNPYFAKEKIKKINDILDQNFKPLAEKYGCSIGQISIAAIASQKGIVALCGARNKEQAKENAAAGEVLLKDTEIRSLKEALSSMK